MVKGILVEHRGNYISCQKNKTDFIFTMLVEEFGFIGGFLTILLYSYIIFLGTQIAIKSQHQFGKLLAIGVVNILFLHMFINIGMVMGLLPVVGTPLPLISYGGTITATMLISFGLLLNVDLHKNTEIAPD